MATSLQETVYRALVYLSSRCDGAITEDGAGFNGRDSGFGKSLAEQIQRGQHLSDNQFKTALKMLQTYRHTQLLQAGLVLPAPVTIPNLPPPPAEKGIWELELLTRGPYCLFRMLVKENKRCPNPLFQQYVAHAKVCGLTWSPKHLGWWGGATAALLVRDKLPQDLGSIEIKDLGPAPPGEYPQDVSEWPQDLSYFDLHPDSPIWAKGGLRPYQHEGIAFLRRPGSWLLGDDMGLGKSLQVLLSIPKELPCIIFAPVAARAVWSREITLHCPRAHRQVQKMKDFTWPEPGEILITNYEKLRLFDSTKMLASIPRNLIVAADEVQALKGGGNIARVKQFRNLMRAMKATGGKIIGLTGTPVLNRIQELYRLLTSLGLEQVVFPGTGRGRGDSSYQEFKNLCGLVDGAFGAEQIRDIHPCVKTDRLPRVMLRRTKAEIFPQMPKKEYEYRDVALPPRLKAGMDDIWDKVKDKWAGRSYDDAMDKSNSIFASIGFETISKMRHDLETVKIEAVLEWVEEMEEGDEPVVVSSCFLELQTELAKRPGWATITGTTKSDDRGTIEDQFQRGELKGIGFTIKAGGVGITLTRANRMAFASLDWTPALIVQAEDRLRPHLQTVSCLYTIFRVNHPLEHRINELLLEKAALIAQVHD